MSNATLRQPILGLAIFGLTWFVLGVVLAHAYLDALWSTPSPLLSGAGLVWLVVGAVGMIALHIHLLLRVWRVV